MAGQLHLDFTQLDPKAADFHLMVHAAEKFDIAVFTHADPITGAIHARSLISAERALQKFFSRKLRAVQVSPPHANTADLQLTLSAAVNSCLIFHQECRAAYWESPCRWALGPPRHSSCSCSR